MKKLYFLLSLLFVMKMFAQPVHYTVANAHSHNDYEQKIPFWTAYNAGFGSIEADIFLENGNLYVAHDTVELKAHRTLEEYYIKPLLSVVSRNGGYVFADSTGKIKLEKTGNPTKLYNDVLNAISIIFFEI